MARNNDETQKFIRIIWQDHKDYWKQRAGELKSIKMHMNLVFGKNNNMMKA